MGATKSFCSFFHNIEKLIYNYDNYYFLLVPYYYYILPFKTSKMYKKSSDFIVPLLCRERKTFFLIPYFYCPLLDPRYLRFTVQIPVFRGGFFPKKKQKIQVCSFVVFVKSSLLQQQQKNICHQKKKKFFPKKKKKKKKKKS